jgi:hypothetical protein
MGRCMIYAMAQSDVNQRPGSIPYFFRHSCRVCSPLTIDGALLAASLGGLFVRSAYARLFVMAIFDGAR